MQTSIAKLNLLHPICRQRAITAYNNAVNKTPNSVHPIVIETLRTFEQQQIYYNQGRTTKGEIITNSKPGYSWHQYGIAVDMGMLINGVQSYEINSDFMIIINAFKEQGFNWGGDWHSLKDYPHVEYPVGIKIGEALEDYENKRFIDGTDYIIL